MSTETVEAKKCFGTLEVECVVRRPDGTIKSTEKSVRNVEYMQHGEQITEITEV